MSENWRDRDCCPCEITWDWDYNLPKDEREGVYVASKNTCPDHRQLAGTPAHEVVVHGENRMKEVARHMMTARLGLPPADYGKIGWWFTAAPSPTDLRVVNVEFLPRDLTAPEQALVQDWADLIWGPARVVVHANRRAVVADAIAEARRLFGA